VVQPVPASVKNNKTGRNRRRRRNRRLSPKTVMTNALGSRISPAGLSFLKCAFAPPDFPSNAVEGVPDEYQGNSLVKKHKYTNAFNFALEQDYYFMLLPIPGVAFWYTSVTQGASIAAAQTFTAVPYSDFNTLFGTDNLGGQAANTVDRFRFISNHFELKPTCNELTWSGGISAFRFTAQVHLRPNAAATTVGNAVNMMTISGLQSLNSTNSAMYVAPFNKGVYTYGFNQAADFPFTNIMENMVNVPTAVIAGDFGQLAPPTGTFFTGFDNNFQCVCIKVTGLNNTTNTSIIQTWACVEYNCVEGTSIAEYQTASPCDATAMAIYRKTIRQLPIGVGYAENANFWQRVLGILKSVTNVGRALPGGYGLASGGVNDLLSGIESIFF